MNVALATRQIRSPALGVAATGGLLIVVVLLAASLLPVRPPWSAAVDIGAEGRELFDGATRTATNLFGYHEPEAASDGSGRSFRWTAERAYASFPSALRASPLEVEILACGCLQASDKPVQLLLNNTPVATFRATEQWRSYRAIVPSGLSHPDYSLLVELRTDLTPLGDGRSVGVALDRVALRQTAPQPIGDPISLIVALAGVAILVGRRELAAAALLALGWLAVGLLYQPQFQPRPVLGIAFVLGFLLLWLLRARIPIPAVVPAALSLWLVMAAQVLGHWTVDDAFISFRYARQMLAGNGLVYNAGERVEGYTNFLWTVLIGGMMRLGADPALAAAALTLGLSFAGVALTTALAWRLTRSPWAWAAGGLLSLSGGFLLYTARGSGMETGLFAVLATATLLVLLGGRWATAGVLTALTMMTRPDGVVLAAICLGYAAWVGWRGYGRSLSPALRYGLTLAALFGPYFLLRWSYYGYLLPNTFYVKVGGTAAQAARGAGYLLAVSVQEPLLPAGLIGGLAGAWTMRRTPAATQGMAVAAFAALFALYVAVVGGDWMPGARFIVPILPALAALAVWGGVGALLPTRRHAPSRHGLMAGATVGLAALLALQLPGTSGYDRNTAVWKEQELTRRYREVGRLIGQVTPPEAWVAVAGAGALAYYADRPIIDQLGLNDLHIAHLPSDRLGTGKPGHEKTDPDYVLGRQPAIIPHLATTYVEGHPDFEASYRRKWFYGPEGRGVLLYIRTNTVLREE